jgi:hypothetical protein
MESQCWKVSFTNHCYRVPSPPSTVSVGGRTGGPTPTPTPTPSATGSEPVDERSSRLQRDLVENTSNSLSQNDRRHILRLLVVEARRFQKAQREREMMKRSQGSNAVRCGPPAVMLRAQGRRNIVRPRRTFSLEPMDNFKALLADIDILMSQVRAKNSLPAADYDEAAATKRTADSTPQPQLPQRGTDDNYYYTLGELMSLHLWD